MTDFWTNFLNRILQPAVGAGRTQTASSSPVAATSTNAARAANRRRGRAANNSQQESNLHLFEDLIRRNAGAGEQDFRLAILNALLRTPHRQVEPYIVLFRFVYDRDPLFFGQLAFWYFDNGSVHDLKQLFIAFLATSKFSEEHRHAGLALLQKLPPYQVERVLTIVKGHREGEKCIEGISASVPRSLRTAIEQYLRERERNCDQFDGVVLHARKSLKSLYASLRIKPGDYAQRVLFDNDPPHGSRLHVLKELAKQPDAASQAKLIIENRIPYRVAISSIKQLTPSLLVALVNAMTPQEVINNLSSLKKRGAMDNADLRQLIEGKLEAAKTDKRVSALKSREAIKVAGLDEELTKRVEAVGDEQIKSKARIKRPTALHIDKSGSMQIAIEVGKQIAAISAPVCEAGLFVYAFDTIAYAITAKGSELSHWEKAFKGIQAGGGTSCGVALEMMRRKRERVEQIVMVTDQGENTPPMLLPTLQQYSSELGVTPDILLVNVGSCSDQLETQLSRAGFNCDTFTFTGDYYSLPSLLPMIAGGTRLELLMTIMSHPMPTRSKKQLTDKLGNEVPEDTSLARRS
jgi:hypothetical protein